MIEDLVNLVEDWDIEYMEDWIKEELQGRYEGKTTEEVKEEYELAFDSEVEVYGI